MILSDAVALTALRDFFHECPFTEKPLSATINFWTEWGKEATQPDFAGSVENMRRQHRT